RAASVTPKKCERGACVQLVILELLIVGPFFRRLSGGCREPGGSHFILSVLTPEFAEAPRLATRKAMMNGKIRVVLVLGRLYPSAGSGTCGSATWCCGAGPGAR